MARVHRDIRNARHNWLHHQSKMLVEKYDLICIEDLSIRSLMKKKQRKGRAIADQGWGIFVNQLIYKAAHKGKHVTKIGRYDASTQTCCSCNTKKEMKLSDREYICENPVCSDYLKAKDRDTNAATNILWWGICATDYELFNYNSNTDELSEIYACGDTTAQHQITEVGVSTKQEITDTFLL